MKKIAIFASGSGTNAENIIVYFKNNPIASIELVLSNKQDAKVLQRAEKYSIPNIFFTKNDLYNTNKVLKILQQRNIDFIVLAGFLWLIPKSIIDVYKNKIVNIHPALLPKYGGKGMYGNYVHKAVIEAGETETGITIHYVNEFYDAGQIIFQAKCPVFKTDTIDSLAQRVHMLEYLYYPQIIEKLLLF